MSFSLYNICLPPLCDQIVTLIPDVYLVRMPDNVRGMLSWFNVGVEIDAWGLHLSCYGMGSFSGHLTFLMATPTFAVVAMAPPIGLFLGLVFQTTTLEDLFKFRLRGATGLLEGALIPYSLPFALFVCFWAYPAVTALAFRAFEECAEWPDLYNTTQRYLVSTTKNYAIECPSDELDRAQGLAWAAIVSAHLRTQDLGVAVCVCCLRLLFAFAFTCLPRNATVPQCQRPVFDLILAHTGRCCTLWVSSSSAQRSSTQCGNGYL